MRSRTIIVILAVAAAFVWTGCAEEEKPIEKAEEEAGAEEIAPEETTKRDIATEGYPEGQVFNAAGTECRDEEAVKHDHSPRSAVQIAGERADQMGLAPEQKHNNMAQAASSELGLARVEPEAIEVYECLVDEGLLEVTPAEQDAAAEKLVQEKGLYDAKAMQSDTFKELFGTDCGYMELGDIRRN